MEEETKEETTMIDDANLAALRLEEANKEKAELLDREELLMSKKALGGKSNAGEIPEVPKELTDVEYSKAIMAGDVLQ